MIWLLFGILCLPVSVWVAHGTGRSRWYAGILIVLLVILFAAHAVHGTLSLSQ
jgi:hypothetical protein